MEYSVTSIQKFKVPYKNGDFECWYIKFYSVDKQFKFFNINIPHFVFLSSKYL